MAFDFPDVFCWIQNLPPISEWETNSISLNISSSTTAQPFLNLTISKIHESSKLSFIITKKPFQISLLISFKTYFVMVQTETTLFIRFPKLDSVPNVPNIFNVTFFTLLFLVCIYESPRDHRDPFIGVLKDHLTSFQSRQASNLLMKLLGSNLQEQWMRSVNLGITNWVGELEEQYQNMFRTPSSMLSYAFSTFGMWKVQVYCPAVCMDVEKSESHPHERLQFSLKYHQVESVFQFNYKVDVKEEWVEIMVNVDNIRCDVTKLVNDSLVKERGAGAAEKHFPSRISLQLTPTLQDKVVSLSVGKSTDNPKKK
ncbi:hypothetical protein KIW84_053831 [Lathyrus oleraceus]|uniref:Uncharacterized protein n=1 Tax=Pisum sativum TaxID=3888 RepID=A0A9D5AHB9_PEA|nr:hypothetical protein KIW84_053831 [Pisum sativum]